jgi:hypothetical protein
MLRPQLDDWQPNHAWKMRILVDLSPSIKAGETVPFIGQPTMPLSDFTGTMCARAICSAKMLYFSLTRSRLDSRE